ncbi:hypothetical protein NMY22_g9598 [Coprinellus aureogranulatus]|nr:hypothetical protein NMY22_g9598 [Coprinellus aureogranulatus]
MYNTTYTYTNNVQISPSSRSHQDCDASPQHPDIETGRQSFLELSTSIFYRLLQAFWIHPRDSDETCDFTLTTVEDSSEAPADKRTFGEVYVYSMIHAGKGFPCWKPEPREPLKAGEGVMPGDVGIFSVEGGFTKVFNIWDDETSIQESEASRLAQAPYKAPPRHAPFIRPNELVKGKALVAGAWYETIFEPDGRTILRFDFRHLASHREGAVLAMTSPGKLEELSGSDKTTLRKFISQHAGLIYDYANGIHAIDEGESLYIITGCIKSENWGLAAFRETPVFREPAVPPHDIPSPRLVKLPGVPGESNPQDPIYDWRSPGTFYSYVGQSQGDGSEDQCLFLRGAGGTGQHELNGRGHFETPGSKPGDRGDNPPGSGGQDNGEGSSNNPRQASNSSRNSAASESGTAHGSVLITSFPDESHHEVSAPLSQAGRYIDLAPQSCHPSDIINQFLLEKTGSDFALCHDDDWRYLLGGYPDSLNRTHWSSASAGHTSQIVSIEHGVAVLSFDQCELEDPLAGGQPAEDPLYTATPVATDETDPSPIPLSLTRSLENAQGNPGTGDRFLCHDATEAGADNSELNPSKEKIPGLAEDSTHSTDRTAQPRKSQIRSHPSHYAVNPTETYALVIGINEYAMPEFRNLKSACIDADNMDEFLRDTLGVPSQNVINLRDGQATRQDILGCFQELEKRSGRYYEKSTEEANPALGPCIVIFFSGHGTGVNSVEALCPSDMCMPVPLKRSKLAGKNHNQGLWRVSPLKRGHPLPEGTDRDGLQATSEVRGCGNKSRESHVLLTACGHGQTSSETAESGQFTRALLKVLKHEAEGSSLTYRTLLTALDMPDLQTPRCEGRHVNRHLFTTQEADPSFIPCMKAGSTRRPNLAVTLRAGTAQGLAPGELFSIHEYDLPISDDNPNPSIGTLCVKDVEKASSVLGGLLCVREGALPSVFYAKKIGRRICFLKIYCNDWTWFNTIFLPDELKNCIVPINDPEERSLSLCVADSRVYIGGADPHLVFYELAKRFSTGLSTSNHEAIRAVLLRWQHFTLHLNLQGENIPQVRMEMHFLEETVVGEHHTGEEGDPRNFRPAGLDLLAQASKPGLVRCGLPGPGVDEKPVGITLHNDSDIPLYPSLLYFDPIEMTIIPWFTTPVGVDKQKVDPPLKAGSTFCIGYGVDSVVSPWSLRLGGRAPSTLDISNYSFLLRPSAWIP